MPPPLRRYGSAIILEQRDQEDDEHHEQLHSPQPTSPKRLMRPSQTVSDLEPDIDADEHQHQPLQRPQHWAQQRQFDQDQCFQPIDYHEEHKPIAAHALTAAPASASVDAPAAAASSSFASALPAAAAAATAVCLPPRERGLDGSLITSMQRLQERQNLVRVLSCNLEQLCPMGAALPANPLFLSLFHTSAMPGISIRDYMERLSIYTAVSEEAMIQACMHIVRLAHNGRIEAEHREAARAANPSNPIFLASAVALVHGTPHPRINSFSSEPFQVSCFNIHRLLLTALLVTAKYSDDAFHNNKLFSSLGGITLRELNQLELEFLSLLDFKMAVDIHEFTFMYAHVFNNPARHGAACCQTHHPMGPHIVCEEQPGCDNPVLDSDIEQARLWHQQQQELEQQQQQLVAAVAAAATAATAATAAQMQVHVHVHASVYPQASPSASPSLAYNDHHHGHDHDADADADCMVDGGADEDSMLDHDGDPEQDGDQDHDQDHDHDRDLLTSTGSSVATSPHQRSVSTTHDGLRVRRIHHASSSSFSSSSLSSSTSSASNTMASPDPTATATATATAVHKEVLWENVASVVPSANDHKRKQQQQQQQQQQPDSMGHSSPTSSSCSSLGLRRISTISLHSVTQQQGATPSPSLSHREYSRKTFGPAGAVSSSRAAAGAAAGAGAAGASAKKGEFSSGNPRALEHTHQTRAHAAYLARHGVTTLWSPSPIDSQQPQQAEDYDVMM